MSASGDDRGSLRSVWVALDRSGSGGIGRRSGYRSGLMGFLLHRGCVSLPGPEMSCEERVVLFGPSRRS